MYYEGQVKKTVVDETGRSKKATVKYIVENCPNCGYAYERIREASEVEGDEIVFVKQCAIMEFANERRSENELIFVAIVGSVFVDDMGNEKSMKYKIACFANNIEEATQIVRDLLKQGYGDINLISVKQSNYIDLIR